MSLRGGSEHPRPRFHFKQKDSETLCLLHALSSYASNRAHYDESFELELFLPAYVESYRKLYKEDPPTRHLTGKSGFNTRAALEAVFPEQFEAVGGSLYPDKPRVRFDDNGIYLLSFYRGSNATMGHVVLIYKGWFIDANMSEPYEITTMKKAGLPLKELLTKFRSFRSQPTIQLVFKYRALPLARGSLMAYVMPDGSVTYIKPD